MIGSLACGGMIGLTAGAMIVQAATIEAQQQATVSGWSSPATITAIFAGLGSLAAVLLTWRQGVRQIEMKTVTEKIADKAEVLAVKQGTIAEKTEQMEQQGNARWTALEKKFDFALAENVELRAVVAQLMPGATAAGVKRAGEKGLVPPVAHPDDGGAGLNQQEKKDVRIEAGGAIDDAEAKRKPESPYKPKESAGPDRPKTG